VQTVALIDYGSGNVHSAQKALERAAVDGDIAARIELTRDLDLIRTADRIVLPGVGAFADCQAGLASVDGLIEVLDEAANRSARPFLGICVGMQLLATRGLEFGETAGLGWIGGEVRAIQPRDDALKIPHMGWNTIDVQRPHPLFEGIPDGVDGWHAYFVHSFHMALADDGHRIATADYGGPLTAAVGRDTIIGTQFHPEKSQKLGLRLLTNFLRWAP